MTFASIRSWPQLERPVLVLGLDGWVDAGYAGATAINALLESVPHDVLATFDSDALLDQRSRRPVLRISHGTHGGLTWPELRLLFATETDGRSLLVLAGPEPDLRWHEWTDEVVALGMRLGVEMVVGLGAFPAPVPHTRPVRLAATASSAELAGRVGFLPATMEVPAGAQAVLEVAFGQAGVPSIGVWARVPHYASGTPYPEASAVLLDELSKLTSIRIDTAALHRAGDTARDQIQALIEASEEHSAMVRQLETQHDSELGLSAIEFSNLPTGDEIAAELERFLRGESR
ncbi:MAG TPA: PAC2 family protein [Acidimicrobiales bacterium]|nr:PAC2 family protein [Acidimicrobiales bacterium]